MDARESTSMRPADRSIMEGTRAIIIEQVTEPQDPATAAEMLAGLLRSWRPALVVALVAAVAAGYWDSERSGQVQGISFTVVRPTCDTPSLPNAADLAKALNSIPSREWNVSGGRGKLEARTEKTTAGVELTFTPKNAGDSTPALCRTEAERMIGELNTLVEPDIKRARTSIDATIAALEASIAQVSALANERSGVTGKPEALLLLQQASDMRERQATQRVARESLHGARLLGNETIVRKASFASPPVTGLIAGCMAFVAALFFIAFGADVAAAYRAGPARNP